MKSTRRRQSAFTYTSQSRSFSYFRKDSPPSDDAATYATSAYYPPQTYGYQPPQAVTQGNYPGYTYGQPVTSPYQQIPQITYQQPTVYAHGAYNPSHGAYNPSHGAYNPHPPATYNPNTTNHLAVPGNQPGGRSRSSRRSRSQTVTSSPGSRNRDIEAWVTGTARENGSLAPPEPASPSSGYASSASDHRDWRDNRSRKRGDGRSPRRGSVYESSYDDSIADIGSRDFGQYDRPGPQPAQFHNGPTPQRSTQPFVYFQVNGQLHAYYVAP